MRCFHVLFLIIALLIPCAARADAPCYKGKEITAAMILDGFIAVADMEVDKHPAILFANLSSGIYFVFIVEQDLMCQVGGGTAFHLYKVRGT